MSPERFQDRFEAFRGEPQPEVVWINQPPDEHDAPRKLPLMKAT
jgi:hypothetical protein